MRVVLLMGATASGKSAWAMEMAQRFSMEIVNADSVQVYRGLEIGASKPTPEERRRVRHHLLDIVEPDESFSAGEYRREALRVIADCQRRRVTPLFVGGTGLYFRVLERGMAPVPPVPAKIRDHLHQEGDREGWSILHDRLRRLDPEYAHHITSGDRQRIVRGLSVVEATGVPLSEWHRKEDGAEINFIAPLFFKLAIFREREALYDRINHRFDEMMAQGLLEEAAALLTRGLDRRLPAMKAVGYRQLFRYLDGEITLEASVALAKQETRRYAKRQMTWLRKEPNLNWFSPGEREQALHEVNVCLS